MYLKNEQIVGIFNKISLVAKHYIFNILISFLNGFFSTTSKIFYVFFSQELSFFFFLTVKNLRSIAQPSEMKICYP